MKKPDATIDLHGNSPTNIRWELLPFLDRGLTENWDLVYVIHGVGKGILKERVWEILDDLDYVDQYRLARYTEGGRGTTVVLYK